MKSRRNRIIHKSPIMMLFISFFWSSSAYSQNLSPDFIISFDYNQSNVSDLESMFEKFAIEVEFKVLNKTKFVKENGQHTPYSTEIIAINESQMVMRLSKLGYKSSTYYVSLTTPPPTVHNIYLENKMRGFIGASTKFYILDERTSNNEESSASTFRNLLTTYQSWFTQSYKYK